MPNWFQRTGAALNVLAKGGSWGDAKRAFQGMYSWSTPPTRGSKELVNMYNTNPWFRLALSKRADAVAGAIWRVYAVYEDAEARRVKRGAKRYRNVQDAANEFRWHALAKYRAQKRLREIDDHPMLDMLSRGNELLSGHSAFRLSVIWLITIGEAFWVIERNAYGMPIGYWPIPPWWVSDTPKPDNPYFKVNFPGWNGDIPATEVKWFRDANPVDPYARGKGRAQSLGDELDADEYAASYVKAFFYNTATPRLLVSVEGVKKPELDTMESDWNNRNQGFFKAWRTHFINRPVTVKELGNSTFQDQQMVPLREFERNTIVQAMGIAPELAGILDSSNRASIDASDYITTKYTIVPDLEFWRREMQVQLMPEFDDKLILDYDNPIPGDKEYNLSVIKAFPHIVTVDELRVMIEQEPIGGVEGETRVRMVNTEPYKLGETLEDITRQKASGKPEPNPPTEPPKPTQSDMQNVVAAVKVEYLADAFGHALPDVVKFNDDTQNYLLNSLCEGLNRDDSLPHMVKRVTNLFAEAKGKRATDVARAEAARAKVDERRLLGGIKKALQKQENEVIRALNALYES